MVLNLELERYLKTITNFCLEVKYVKGIHYHN